MSSAADIVEGIKTKQETSITNIQRDTAKKTESQENAKYTENDAERLFCLYLV